MLILLAVLLLASCTGLVHKEREQVHIYIYSEIVADWEEPLTKVLAAQIEAVPVQVKVFPFAEALVTTHMVAAEADVYLVPYEFWHPLLDELGVAPLNELFPNSDIPQHLGDYVRFNAETGAAELLALPIDGEHHWFKTAKIETWESWLAILPFTYQNQEYVLEVMRFLANQP
ncbi:hypothetical protein J2S00_001373 [Caldalkalibacillus uzonensis]|uniref:Extracellular solute-binding protein n=1 Tax=Caldalkalibacillus uzonensis TaxID=353224 RepID=A0ABU0CQA4_9BACI|nr:hypothetical protein [Caldalkalibacillus uzonensis]MDQ0338587.1 hypothetical protein [Caldalkalibacillus uzonensis]